MTRKTVRPLKKELMDLVHIDLETLSRQTPDAAIIEIGAVYKDKTFSCVVDFDDTIQHGSVDIDTMRFHLKNPARATALGLVGSDHGHPKFVEALRMFAEWYQSILREHPNVVPCTRDLDFDIAILTYHFKAHGIAIPWRYYQPVGHRSCENMLRQVLFNVKGIEFPIYVNLHFVKHEALDDAKWQGLYLDLLQFMIVADEEASRIMMEQVTETRVDPDTDSEDYAAEVYKVLRTDLLDYVAERMGVSAP